MNGYGLGEPGAVLGHPQHEPVSFLRPLPEVVVQRGLRDLTVLHKGDGLLYADGRPVARSLKGSIEISSELELAPV